MNQELKITRERMIELLNEEFSRVQFNRTPSNGR